MKSIDDVLNNVANKNLLVVFPHPDDESVMAGGIIQRALFLGFVVTVLTLTEGNNGKIFVSGKGRSLAEIRREEMAEAMSRLGVVDWVMWKFDDGKLRETDGWKKRLTEFIKDTRPGIIVTYDLSGVSGHPDHISVALLIWQTVKKIGGIKLIWSSFEGELKMKVVDNRVLKYLQKPEFELEMTFFESWRKWWAVFAHKSQNLQGFLGSPWWYLVFKARREWYSEAKPAQIYRYKYVGFKI
jgi:LmbE family N-acetylglucosaminyl deacetylase